MIRFISWAILMTVLVSYEIDSYRRCDDTSWRCLKFIFNSERPIRGRSNPCENEPSGPTIGHVLKIAGC